MGVANTAPRVMAHQRIAPMPKMRQGFNDDDRDGDRGEEAELAQQPMPRGVVTDKETLAWPRRP
jgi:hypothetical protein